jgi:hypothetical protein
MTKVNFVVVSACRSPRRSDERILPRSGGNWKPDSPGGSVAGYLFVANPKPLSKGTMRGEGSEPPRGSNIISEARRSLIDRALLVHSNGVFESRAETFRRTGPPSGPRRPA